MIKLILFAVVLGFVVAAVCNADEIAFLTSPSEDLSQCVIVDN
jgi:hypothetical protein